MVCRQQAVGEAKQLLGLCCTAAELMKSGQLFRAHQALARIRTEHFKEWDVSAEKARCAPAAASAVLLLAMNVWQKLGIVLALGLCYYYSLCHTSTEKKLL
jgi:hypothetical protein